MADYRVRRGATLLSTLTRTGHDMPWWEGMFELAPAFEALRKVDELVIP